MKPKSRKVSNAHYYNMGIESARDLVNPAKRRYKTIWKHNPWVMGFKHECTRLGLNWQDYR